MKTCLTLEITKETFDEKIDVFEDEAQQNVIMFFEILREQELDREAIRKWNLTPHDKLLTHMFGCPFLSFCPFCKGLCDQISGNHEKEHFTLIHRPQCLTGYMFVNTGKLVHFICPQCCQ